MIRIQKLCVIDDDLIYQFAVKLNIQQLQLAETVLTFSNGDLAKTWITENHTNPNALPDVILLDINMPIMDGWDFLEWFTGFKSRMARSIPIFMVSSSIDWRDIERAKSYPDVLDYISKPITEGNFFEIVHRLGSHE
jgi:CheY-like chemotaxis protein